MEVFNDLALIMFGVCVFVVMAGVVIFVVDLLTSFLRPTDKRNNG